MKTWTKITPSFIDTRWFTVLLSFFVVLLSGLAGGLVAGVTWSLAGKEIFILSALLGSWLILFLSAVKFDFMVLASFCLFSLVRTEPAPTDVLVTLLFMIGLLTGKLSLKTLAGSSLIHIVLWGFLFTNLASLIFVNEIFEGFYYLFITAYVITFAYFVKMYITSYQAMRTVMIGYLVSAMLAVFLVALGYLGIGTELLITGSTRARGLFNDANVFGPFLILMIVFLVDEILHPCILRGLYSVKLFGLICLTLGVFLSGSRAAWGNLVLSMTIYFVLVFKGAPRAKLAHLFDLLKTRMVYRSVLLIVGLFILVALFARQGFLEFIRKFFAVRAQFQVYDTTRFARQIEGIYAGFTHLIGVGPGMWGDAHSLYVRTFAEHGILGLVSLLLLLLILSVRTLLRACRESDKVYGLSARVVFACLVGHLMNSIVIDTVHWRHFWFLLALAWVVITAKLETVAPSYLEGNGGER